MISAASARCFLPDFERQLNKKISILILRLFLCMILYEIFIMLVSGLLTSVLGK